MPGCGHGDLEGLGPGWELSRSRGALKLLMMPEATTTRAQAWLKAEADRRLFQWSDFICHGAGAAGLCIHAVP